jgi:carboxymethylenebutenolidase
VSPESLGRWVTLEVEGANEMRCWSAGGADAGGPGLLLLQDAFGVGPHLRDVAGRFARAGYTVIAPELFHRRATGFESSPDRIAEVMEQIRALTTDGLIADLRAAHAWLVGAGAVDASRVAALGFCMGGRAAFLANTALPLAASVSYYGGGIAEGLLDRVGALAGPQLLYWAGRDARILPEHVRAVEDGLRAAGKKYVSVVFSDSQHSFFQDFIEDRYDSEAARQSWALSIAFLQEHV